ncbi:hypothetical protein [Aestuariivivens sediminicola]|uniref:hypothetical protein n=1 Tax=Aestuariivivens sediminicola TaxID=2913560 RepID=UPI001F5705EE|nr:hypothetical protein [Aestuariivivens sediminicola]
MNNDKFWQILDNNLIYFKEGNWSLEYNEYILRLGHEVSLLPHFDRKSFFTKLYSKFNSLFTKKHIEIFLLNYLSEDLFSDHLHNSTFLWNLESKQEMYSNQLFINSFRVFRFNLIIHGKKEFKKFKKDPLSIIEQRRFIEEEGSLNIFMLREIVNVYLSVGIKEYNIGTFTYLFKYVHPTLRMSKIKFGKFIEDTDLLIDKLDDFCGICGLNLRDENKVLSSQSIKFLKAKKKSLSS